MAGPDIALAASARDWGDRLHRFVLDHGGATVRARPLSHEHALSVSVDVLFIDDVCSFLTPKLVADLRSAGVAVVGVFDSSDGTDAKRHLLEAGITDVIESNATPSEFIALCSSEAPREPTSDRIPEVFERGLRVGVTGPAGGVGVTEIACGLASALADEGATVLVDADLVWPNVGQRLGLEVHPNLMSAIDISLHDPGRLASATQPVDRMRVVAGLANPA
ncbi:MAG: hypothetical protein KDB69_08605, partial [Acidimicrobiia bacterium]|nr:hypothetical protein [Acidimicrobiia bacterium]